MNGYLLGHVIKFCENCEDPNTDNVLITLCHHSMQTNRWRYLRDTPIVNLTPKLALEKIKVTKDLEVDLGRAWTSLQCMEFIQLVCPTHIVPRKRFFHGTFSLWVELLLHCYVGTPYDGIASYFNKGYISTFWMSALKGLIQNCYKYADHKLQQLLRREHKIGTQHLLEQKERWDKRQRRTSRV